jgi:hypothetical protein
VIAILFSVMLPRDHCHIALREVIALEQQWLGEGARQKNNRRS